MEQKQEEGKHEGLQIFFTMLTCMLLSATNIILFIKDDTWVRWLCLGFAIFTGICALMLLFASILTFIVWLDDRNDVLCLTKDATHEQLESVGLILIDKLKEIEESS